ncbi:MAG: class I fructose-bisphosphate aldolase [Rhodospirillales bacterium]|nr:class I fructose-bisphosphate aldolase [Rhodospirillales bacterium]
MHATPEVKRILSHYEGESPALLANLGQILMHGSLAGTGRVVILPVDQGFEHGPGRSFAPNPDGYDPHYHYQLALDAGLSALAAPLGFLQAGIDTFAGRVPLILKLNGGMSWSTVKDQAVTASVSDAVRLGCAAVGFTMYPCAEAQYGMMEELRDIIREARTVGLPAVVWSYPRGGALAREDETALDVTAYAAHLAALIGAHVIKVKPPTAHLAQKEAAAVYAEHGVPAGTLSERVRHVMQAAFDGRRIVVFSGGSAKGQDAILAEVEEIARGGGHGSIIGRNSFQRKKPDALALLGAIVDIYRSAC